MQLNQSTQSPQNSHAHSQHKNKSGSHHISPNVAFNINKNPANPWAKQNPHAKQGLATDIVMGDESVFSGRRQFSSTMKIHYPSHHHLIMGNQSKNAIKDLNLTLGEQHYLKLKMDELNMPPAGRPLGISSATREIHMVLGDRDKHQPERLQSVTAQEYKAHPISIRKESPMQNKARPSSTSQEPSMTARERWVTKNELIMSAAHIGIKTRLDLPTDERHFKNLQTTNQEAYLPPSSNATFSSSSDPSAKASQPVLPERFDKKPRGATSIPQGDREKQTSYDTVAATSFIRHDPEVYNRDRSFRHHRDNCDKKQNHQAALLGLSGEPRVYQTTSQDTYKSIQSVASVISIPRSERGKSCIVFGEHFGDASIDSKHLPPTHTVTQRDFKDCGEDIRALVHQSNKNRSRDITRVHANTTAPPVAPRPTRLKHPHTASSSATTDYPSDDTQKQKKQYGPDPKLGVFAALCPYSGDGTWVKSCTNEDFGHDVSVHGTASSREPAWSSADQMYKSSIPTGDAERYPSQGFSTTSAQSYVAHPDAETPTFPVLGARITQSNFSLGDGITDTKMQVQSTAASAFVDHGPIPKRNRKPISQTSITGSVNGEYPMSDNKTTNTVVYAAPHEEDRDRVIAAAPQSAAASLLFPLKNHREHVYETTTQSFFGKRDGILNVSQPSSTLHGGGNTAKDMRGGSSIAFGDRRHFTTKGEPIFRRNSLQSATKPTSSAASTKRTPTSTPAATAKPGIRSTSKSIIISSSLQSTRSAPSFLSTLRSRRCFLGLLVITGAGVLIWYIVRTAIQKKVELDNAIILPRRAALPKSSSKSTVKKPSQSQSDSGVAGYIFKETPSDQSSKFDVLRWPLLHDVYFAETSSLPLSQNTQHLKHYPAANDIPTTPVYSQNEKLKATLDINVKIMSDRKKEQLQHALATLIHARNYSAGVFGDMDLPFFIRLTVDAIGSSTIEGWIEQGFIPAFHSITYKPPLRKNYFVHQNKTEVLDINKTEDKEDVSVPAPDISTPRRANATFLILCRNKDLGELRLSIRRLEDRFNSKYQYPYTLINDVPFSQEFMDTVRGDTKAKVEFGVAETESWSYPPWLNTSVADTCRKNMKEDGIIYGGNLPYRHMCRWNSGWFFRHPLVRKYEYYWRVEPGVQFFCDITVDPFLYMQDNGKEYGFTVALGELMKTIPSLYGMTRLFAEKEGLGEMPFLKYFQNEITGGYNGCHFWSNFEIARVGLWNSELYLKYFDFLDRWGGFFYERWGDAPVHSLFLGIALRPDQVHHFAEIGYQHEDFYYCSEKGRLVNTCICPLEDIPFARNMMTMDSCMTRFGQHGGSVSNIEAVNNRDSIPKPKIQ